MPMRDGKPCAERGAVRAAAPRVRAMMGLLAMPMGASAARDIVYALCRPSAGLGLMEHLLPRPFALLRRICLGRLACLRDNALSL